MSSSPHKKTARGFTLVEVAIVLAVFAIIIAGIWSLVAVLYEKAREHNASLQVQAIIRNVQAAYGRVGELVPASGGVVDYTKIFDQQAIFPTDMKINPNNVGATADGKINHPWSTNKSGTVTVLAGVQDANNEQTLYWLHYSALPKKACVYLTMQLPSQMTHLNSITFSGTGNCYGPGCSSPAGTIPLGLVSANVECKFADNSNGTGQNDIQFVLSIH